MSTRLTKLAGTMLLGLIGAAMLGHGQVIFAINVPRAYLQKPEAWYGSDEAKRIADNILSYQSDLGGWPKNTDTTKAPFAGNRKDLKPSFDNDATTDELRVLARVYKSTKDERYRKG